MLTSNDAVEDIQCETTVISSILIDMSSSPRAVHSFRKAKFQSSYQSVQAGQQPVNIMQQNKYHCRNHSSKIIELSRHTMEGMLHASSPQAGVLSEQGQSQAGCAGGPAGGAARGSCQAPAADPSRRGPAEPAGCLRWDGCPSMLHGRYLVCINTHSF